MNRSISAALIAGVLALLGWAAVAQDQTTPNPAPANPAVQNPSPDDMGMMMKMMESRPKELKQADSAVGKAKADAMKKGTYTCCLKHPCDVCALHMGACPCGKNVAADKPVCNECKGGWDAGDGAIPGKTAADIKTMPRGPMDMKAANGAAPAAGAKTVVMVCPIMGSPVKGEGAGMTVVDNYEVHFCCDGCKPAFDKMTKDEQLAKIKTVLAKNGTQ
jgi:hypothetical protein